MSEPLTPEQAIEDLTDWKRIRFTADEKKNIADLIRTIAARNTMLFRRVTVLWRNVKRNLNHNATKRRLLVREARRREYESTKKA